jgi:[acyl-carrier-protein] S-malonyltransferase
MQSKKAYLFPGQGSQFIGMGKDIYENSVKGKELFDYANQLIQFPITDIMFNGPEEALKKTDAAQLAIFLHSFILTQISKDFSPDVVAGHSLGEITALAAAKIITFEEAIELIKNRGKAMDEACQSNPSTMAAVLGLEDEVIEDACNTIGYEQVMPVNYNCPGQVVISGTIKGVEQAQTKLYELGAKKIVLLNVSGGFHTPLMNSAKEKLKAIIEPMNFRKGIAPICQNRTSEITSNVEEIKANLIEHITSPVLWHQSINTMKNFGVNNFIECSTTKILQNLLKKILTSDEAAYYNISY